MGEDRQCTESGKGPIIVNLSNAITSKSNKIRKGDKGIYLFSDEYHTYSIFGEDVVVYVTDEDYRESFDLLYIVDIDKLLKEK